MNDQLHLVTAVHLPDLFISTAAQCCKSICTPDIYDVAKQMTSSSALLQAQ